MALTKNSLVDAAGMRSLATSPDRDGYQGITGSVEDARITDLALCNGRAIWAAQMVLCDGGLGVYWVDGIGNMHGAQTNDLPRSLLEVLAVELIEWTRRHPGVDLTETVLLQLGFESAF